MSSPSSLIPVSSTDQGRSQLGPASVRQGSWGPYHWLEAEAPRADSTALLHAFPQAKTAFWLPAQGPEILTLGETRRLVARGDDRIEQIQKLAEQLFAEAGPLPDSERKPRLIGGFSFLPLAPNSPWAELGEGLFRLPRWTLESVGNRTHILGLAPKTPGEDERLQAEAAALLQLHAELAQSPSESKSPTEPELSPRAGRDLSTDLLSEPGASAQWCAKTEDLISSIQQGQFQKVVHARVVQSPRPHHLDLASALTGLDDQRSVATRFGIREGNLSFLGASPELLISKQGQAVSSEALAGTLDQAESRNLQESRKDRHEQRFVIDAIRKSLAPHCRDLTIPAEPKVRSLPGLKHLVSPIEGRLNHPTHILRLVRDLHPTPAVGGLPRQEALSWIAENEPETRGWYAAPFGCFDSSGNGSFLVALRSLLLSSDEIRLYAGAGIIDGSEARAEWAECGLKLKTASAALGHLAGRPT